VMLQRTKSLLYLMVRFGWFPLSVDGVLSFDDGTAVCFCLLFFWSVREQFVSVMGNGHLYLTDHFIVVQLR